MFLECYGYESPGDSDSVGARDSNWHPGDT